MDHASLSVVLDLHCRWVSGGPSGKRANLRGANLRGANLEYADLGGANLEYADLGGASLEYADLRGASLRGANLRGANLEYADLGGANLEYADLGGASLRKDTKIIALITRITRVEDPYEFFAWRTDEGDFIKAGCRFLNVAEYREHVENYKNDTKKYTETTAILDFIEARFNATK